MNESEAAAAAAPVPPSLRPAAPGLVAAPPPVPPAPAPTDALVERWWTDTFPGSVVGRSTELWNFVFAAKEDLKRRLKGSL